MSKYYPLSQIKTNLYTKGNEYVISSTGLSYKGYYHEISNGQKFSGKTTTDTPISLLSPIEIGDEDEENDKNTIDNKKATWTIGNPNYQYGQNLIPTLPTSYYPKITSEQYKLGEFERYFLSKNNEIKFKEVNLFTYNQYLTKDPSVSFQIFSPIKLSWGLTGNREKTYTINYNTVKRISLNLKLRGFVEYFQGRFTQFYKEIGD